MLLISFLISLSILLYIIISYIILTEQKNDDHILQSSSLFSPLFFASVYSQYNILETTLNEFSISISHGLYISISDNNIQRNIQ